MNNFKKIILYLLAMRINIVINMIILIKIKKIKKIKKIYKKNFNFLKCSKINSHKLKYYLIKNKKKQKIKIYYKYNNYLKIVILIKTIKKKKQ